LIHEIWDLSVRRSLCYIPLVVALNSTFGYIEDVLSISNDQFHSYVDSVFPSELEIKDATESSSSASYLDVLLKSNYCLL
jgi:hypothetical protein